MHDDSDHLGDLNLIEKCLAGEETAIKTLQETYAAALMRYLIGKGGSPHEADEVVHALWADGLAGTPTRGPLFNHYTGQSSLQTWLKTVAVNLLVDRKRKEARDRIEWRADAADEESISEEEQRPFEMRDTTLFQLLRAALEMAFSKCSDEEFVMLHLRHQNDLQVGEIARMWKLKSSSTISRALDAAREGIAKRTLENIHVIDPWLHITWADFLEMCKWTQRTDLGDEESLA